MKHRWQRDEAGFEPGGRGPIGKCHASITEAVAQSLPDQAVEEPPLYLGAFSEPRRLFNVYRGTPYVAVPTIPGRSWHGYPWKGRLHPTVMRTLEERALACGDLSNWKNWIREHCQ